jgi:CubicO group peptidase (beta-lactamase class C family)
MRTDLQAGEHSLMRNHALQSGSKARAAIAWLALGAALAFGTSASAADALDGFVLDTMRQWGVPGMAVAVVRDDRVVFARGYGVRESGRADKVDGDTIFGIGSMTKSFTAAAAAALVDEGKLDWDRPVIDVLPEYRLHDPWVTTIATVRDLASHRVGVDADLLWMARTWNGARTLERAHAVRPYGRFGDFMY